MENIFRKRMEQYVYDYEIVTRGNDTEAWRNF